METKFNSKLVEISYKFFPTRNGVKPEVTVGRNFTEETLKYMTKPYIAKYIADKLEFYLQNSKFFMIEVCSGIGGNTLEFLSRPNCVSLMGFERNRARYTMLQRNIMAYNLGDKAMIVNDEVTGNESFDDFNDAVFFMDPPWLPADLVDAGDDYTKHYILKDMKVGNLTLEEWLTKLQPTAYAVILRLPPNYELADVPGWTYDVENLGMNEKQKAFGKDGKLYMCFNNRHIRGIKPFRSEQSFKGIPGDVFGGYSENKMKLSMKLSYPSNDLTKKYENYRKQCESYTLEVARSTEKCFLYTKYGFKDTTEIFGDMSFGSARNVQVEGSESRADGSIGPIGSAYAKPEARGEVPITVPIKGNDSFPTSGPVGPSSMQQIPLENQVVKFNDLPRPSKGLDKSSPEWISEFQNFIGALLSKFISKPDIVKQMISSTQILIWIQAFTHDSFDPDPSNNYQTLETLGDAIIGYGFFHFVLKKFDDKINPSSLTSFKQEYVSKEFQSLITKGLTLDKWVRVEGVENSKKIQEDICESFLGALVRTGDNVKFGIGYILAQKFIDLIYSKAAFDDLARYGAAKTQVNQLLEQLNLKKPTITALGATPNVLITVKIADEDISRLQGIVDQASEALIPKNGIIGKGKGISNTVAEKIAFAEALIYLTNIGLTDEFVKSIKRKSDLDQIAEAVPGGDKLIKILEVNLKNNDYIRSEFDHYQDGNTVVYNLIGITKDGNRVKLGMAKSKDRLTAKVEAIKDYLDL